MMFVIRSLTKTTSLLSLSIFKGTVTYIRPLPIPLILEPLNGIVVLEYVEVYCATLVNMRDFLVLISSFLTVYYLSKSHLINEVLSTLYDKPKHGKWANGRKVMLK